MTFVLSPHAEIMNAGEIKLPAVEYDQVQYVSAQFLKGKTPKAWKGFPDEGSNWANLPPEERKRLAEQLRSAMMNGKVMSLWMSFDPWGEDCFLSADFENGRAALLYNACDECAAAPCDPDRPDGGEDARVDIGGQTPVPKMCAVEDMAKAAEILLYFLENGKLSPETRWAVCRGEYVGLPWDEIGG